MINKKEIKGIDKDLIAASKELANVGCRAGRSGANVASKDKVRVSEINAMEVDGITFLEYVDDGEVAMILSENGMYDYLGYMSICDFGDLTVDNCIRWIEMYVN